MRKLVVFSLVLFLSSAFGFGDPVCPARAQDSSGAMQTEKAVEIPERPIIEARKIILPGLRVEYTDRDQIVEIENMEFVGPNIMVWDAISKGEAGPDRQRLVDAIYLTGIRIDSDDEFIMIDRCSFTDIWVTPEPFMEGNTDDPDFWEENLIKIIRAGSVKRFELLGLTVRPSEDEEDIIYLDNFTLTDVDGGAIGNLLLNGLSVYDKEVRVDVASVRLEKSDFSKLLDLFIKYPDLDPEEHQAEIIDSLVFDLLELEGLSVAGEEVVGLDHLAFRGLGDRKLDTIDLSGFEFEGEDEAKAYLDSIRGRGFDYSNLLKVMESEEEFDPENGFPLSWDYIAVNGLTVDTEKGDHVFIREISTSDVKYDNIIPVSYTFSLQGLELDAEKISDPKVKQGLAMFGYEKLSLGFKLDYSYDAAAKLALVKEFSIGAEEAGKLILSFALGGVDFEQVKSKEDLAGLLPTLTLKRAEVRYIDESLAPKALEFVAKTQNISVEEMRGQLIGQIENQPMYDVSSPEAAAVVKTLIQFINDPKNLALIAEPQAPTPVLMLAGQAQESPEALAEALNLSLVVNNGSPVKIKLEKVK